ncbi:MAG TPA: hypothetical protein VG710_08095 [Opitutus sp.]|nr:hypothetical protein [Opitutus sp.]
MPPWLKLWIGRWLAGERLEKAKPGDYRTAFGFLFLMPVFLLVFMKIGRAAFDSSSGVVLWAFSSAAIGFGLVVLFAWSRFVPARVSLVLGIIAWAAFAVSFL